MDKQFLRNAFGNVCVVKVNVGKYSRIYLYNLKVYSIYIFGKQDLQVKEYRSKLLSGLL